MKVWPLNKLVSWLTAWLIKEEPPSEVPLCDIQTLRQKIRPCDVLLIEGRSRVSEIIKITTRSPWSHAALYIGRLSDITDPALKERLLRFYQGPEDEQLLIEGVLGKGIIATPLMHYEKDHIRICRPTGIAKEDVNRVIAFTIHELGDSYNIRHIFDLLRLLFPISFMPRYWLSSIFKPEDDKNTSKKQICSTLLAEAFASIKFPVLPKVVYNKDGHLELIRRNPNLTTPSDFDYSPYFEIVKYPLLHLHRNASYHNLPWNADLISNDARGLSSCLLSDRPAHPKTDEDQNLSIS